MKNDICRMLGCEFPLFAFSHCRDVVAAVSKAGGFGVLGGSGFTPESLEVELNWIDEHIDGKPYGVDILVPENLPDGMVGASGEQLAELVGAQHRDFVESLLGRYGVKASAADTKLQTHLSLDAASGEQLMDVAFRHPIKLIANALGIAPKGMIARARDHNVPVAALVGAKEHALRQVQAGVDIIVAQGGEAGGHCGEVSTLVLVPEVIEAIREIREVPVLAAGGIMNGRQMAGMMALGAQGAWTGSVWLATTESETTTTFRKKMVAASSRDTVRSSARTGKPARQLRSAWHDNWEGSDSPGVLPMPLMPMLSVPAFELIDKAAEAGNPQAAELASYFVGQGVGLVTGITSARQVAEQFKQEFVDAVTALNSLVE